MRYEVQGIDEVGKHTVLHDCNEYDAALAWARGYVKQGNFGGWEQIHLTDNSAFAGNCILRIWDPEQGETAG